MKTLAIALFFHLQLGATVLGDLAAGMNPGEWKILSQDGDGSGMGETLLSVPGQDVLQYASKAKWDSFSKRFLFIGQGHYSLQKFISYTEATNKWAVEPKPSWDCSSTGCIGHAYEHNTIDPGTGDFYYGFYGWTRKPVKLSRATGQWSELPQAPAGKVSCCSGFEYFPELGGLVLVSGGYVHFLSSATNQWTTLASGLAMGPYHHFANYNPAHKIIFCGGGNGSSDIYKVEPSGGVTKLKNAPISMGGTMSVQAADPVSGRYLVWGGDESFREYDPSNDTWRTISTGGKELIFVHNRGSGCGGVAAPVADYGVIFVLTWDFYRSKALLYKHASGTGTQIQSEPPASSLPPRIGISPNPVRSAARISVGGFRHPVQARIYDLSGKAVATVSIGAGGGGFDASRLAAGVYILKAGKDAERIGRAFLVEK